MCNKKEEKTVNVIDRDWEKINSFGLAVFNKCRKYILENREKIETGELTTNATTLQDTTSAEISNGLTEDELRGLMATVISSSCSTILAHAMEVSALNAEKEAHHESAKDSN